MLYTELEWTTKNGDKIQIKDMDTDHIKNCVKLLNKREPCKGRSIARTAFCIELANRREFDFIKEHLGDVVILNKPITDEGIAMTPYQQEWWDWFWDSD